MNIVMQNLVERLRSLVGLNGWDYCIYWKLSEDERFLEWLGCCCGGTESNKNAGEEHLFPVSSVVSCRDTTYPHPRTKPCDLLSQLSTSIPIDNSGIYTQTLLTNQPSWVNYSNSLDSSILDETMGTQVLISAPGGLIELFVTKQCIEAVNHSMSFNIDVNSMSNMQQNPLLGDENEGNNSRNTHFHPSDVMTMDHRIGLCSSPLNFMQQFNYNQLNRMKSDAFSEEYQGSFFHDKQTNPEDEHDNTYQKSLMTTDSQYMESLEAKEKQEEDKELLKHVVARSDSMSDCSEQNEEEEDGKYRRRNGKGNQSKNLMAERKRRKKLNDRLYKLRSLVPRISKLDRASILGDAIEYVKDLQKQVKELQDELEENADTESNCINGNNDNNNNQYVGVGELCPNSEPAKGQSGLHVGTSANGYVYKQKEDAALIEKQTQQMEPQVEVALIDGNEYFVKVFCEHRPGGFVKLMESLNTIGMDVVHATVTSHKGLVSNVFEVEKKDNETVEAEDVRESLLELTRNRYRGWSHEVTPTSENAVGRDQHQIPSFSHHFHT
ncbi:Transcription factor ABORTED MICROSPORES Basic helix-loop-helix protein [Vigna angularis]|uniref:Transcription factor ABORTED MICROSPORES Basic helix-loop-helix protein n=1 Tax=Phaseolus angularis TaxID=3914 RepID=A0A8T0KN43_PHAAN|nr:Transcription factor ABORTED MICROSPORES Basic helix-loop-helix protein [Vigna angularis]